MKNIRFEIYLRFIWIQTYRKFYFSRRLFAKYHTLSSWCRIFSSRSRSHEIRILLETAFWQTLIIVNYWWKFYSDRTMINLAWRRLKTLVRSPRNCIAQGVPLDLNSLKGTLQKKTINHLFLPLFARDLSSNKMRKLPEALFENLDHLEKL